MMLHHDWYAADDVVPKHLDSQPLLFGNLQPDSSHVVAALPNSLLHDPSTHYVKDQLLAPPSHPAMVSLLADFALPAPYDASAPHLLLNSCHDGDLLASAPMHSALHQSLSTNAADLSPKSLSVAGLGCASLNGSLISYFQSAPLNHDVGGTFASDFLSALPPAVKDMSTSVSRNMELLRQDEFSSLSAKLQRPSELSPAYMAAQQHLLPPGVSPTWKSRPTLVSSSAKQASVDGLNTKTTFDDHADQNHEPISIFEEAVGERDALAGENDDDIDESGDGSGVLYDTDDAKVLEAPAAGVFAEKGKGKKGPPAKNLMAERRRRKKLNDRLYTLRSVVPKITKMDRASILGDAIEYLKELLQRINDLHNELEASPAEKLPLLQDPPSLQSLTPSSPCRMKEDCPSSMTSPDTQLPKVEVRTREGRAINIHMFCERRPGLLLSTMRALDGLGLDVQQAVISCFNGFALDVFRAEQSLDCEVAAEEIKRVLLLTASAHGGL